MSKTVIAIDPVTRLEGHLKVEVQVEDGKVADAWITGVERMRGGGQIREHQAGEREAKHDESGNTV